MINKVKEKGQGLVEYASILMLVALIVIGVLLLLGLANQNYYTNLIARLPF